MGSARDVLTHRDDARKDNSDSLVTAPTTDWHGTLQSYSAVAATDDDNCRYAFIYKWCPHPTTGLNIMPVGTRYYEDRSCLLLTTLYKNQPLSISCELAN